MYPIRSFQKRISDLKEELAKSPDFTESHESQIKYIAENCIYVSRVIVYSQEVSGAPSHTLLVGTVSDDLTEDMLSAITSGAKVVYDHKPEHSNFWTVDEIDKLYQKNVKDLSISTVMLIVKRKLHFMHEFAKKAKLARYGSVFAAHTDEYEFRLLFPAIHIFDENCDIEAVRQNIIRLQRLIKDALKNNSITIFDLSPLALIILYYMHEEKYKGADPNVVWKWVYKRIYDTGYIDGVYVYDERELEHPDVEYLLQLDILAASKESINL